MRSDALALPREVGWWEGGMRLRSQGGCACTPRVGWVDGVEPQEETRVSEENKERICERLWRGLEI